MAIKVNDLGHEHLIEQIKTVGRELIRDAEKFVPDVEHLNKFSIEIEFPIPSNSGIPEITVMSGVVSGKYVEDIIEVHGDYTTRKFKSNSEVQV